MQMARALALLDSGHFRVRSRLPRVRPRGLGQRSYLRRGVGPARPDTVVHNTKASANSIGDNRNEPQQTLAQVDWARPQVCGIDTGGLR